MTSSHVFLCVCSSTRLMAISATRKASTKTWTTKKASTKTWKKRLVETDVAFFSLKIFFLLDVHLLPQCLHLRVVQNDIVNSNARAAGSPFFPTGQKKIGEIPSFQPPPLTLSLPLHFFSLDTKQECLRPATPSPVLRNLAVCRAAPRLPHRVVVTSAMPASSCAHDHGAGAPSPPPPRWVP